jgi:hypothetical protein
VKTGSDPNSLCAEALEKPRFEADCDVLRKAMGVFQDTVANHKERAFEKCWGTLKLLHFHTTLTMLPGTLDAQLYDRSL